MNKILKDKKGITLIVLVITIIILLILVGITLTSIGEGNGLLSKTKLAKEKYEISEAKEELELKIAQLMLDEENKGDGLQKEDLPKLNNDKIDVGSTEEFPVDVIYDIYKFQIDENYNVKYIGKAEGTIITYSTMPEGYTNNEEVKILIIAKNEKGIKTIEYPNETVISYNGKKKVAIDYNVTKNDTYKFKIIDVENKEIEKDVLIDKIDKLAPLDFTPEVERVGKNIIIKENAEDAEADEISTKSGIDHYEYYLIDEDNNKTKYDKNIIENVIDSYQLYVIAYDRAGNYKQSNIVEVEKFTLKEPEITANTKEWTNENVIVEVNYGNIGTSYIKEISIDGGNTYFEYTAAIEIQKNTLVKARIRNDSESVESEFKIDNIDKLPPNDFTPTVLDEISSTDLQINASTVDDNTSNNYGTSGIKGYKYYAEKNGSLVISSGLIAANTWNASGLVVGESYDIYVESYDNAGNITKSTVINYTKLEVYIWDVYSYNSTKTYSYNSTKNNTVKFSQDKYYPRCSSLSQFDKTTGYFIADRNGSKIEGDEYRFSYTWGYYSDKGFEKQSDCNKYKSTYVYDITSIDRDSVEITSSSVTFNKVTKYYRGTSVITFKKGEKSYGTVVSHLYNEYPVNGYQNERWYIKR